MKIKYEVITKINSLKGNLFNPILYRNNGEVFEEAMSLMDTTDNCSTSPQVENFDVGEICIVDDCGREINGKKRKPSKWDVAVEEYECFDDALSKAIEVSNE